MGSTGYNFEYFNNTESYSGAFMATEAGDFPPPLENSGVLVSESSKQQHEEGKVLESSIKINTLDKDKRKRRREEWERAREETERFESHRGLGNILRRAEDLLSETDALAKQLHVPVPTEAEIPLVEKIQLKKAHEKRLTDMLGTVCKKILTVIMSNKWALPFNAPVNTNIYGDYLQKIKVPMDFGTIKRKLDGGMYKHPEQFVEDVRLVFNNARTYNKPGSDVHVMASTLQEKFEDRYTASIVPRLVEEVKRTDADMMECRQGIAERAALGGRERADGECAGLIQAIDSLISDIDMEKLKAAARCQPVDRASKERICEHLKELPEEDFGKVLGIVTHHYPGVKTSKEVSFDVETLDALCLRQIMDYVEHLKHNGPNDTWPPQAFTSSKKKKI